MVIGELIMMIIRIIIGGGGIIYSIVLGRIDRSSIFKQTRYGKGCRTRGDDGGVEEESGLGFKRVFEEEVLNEEEEEKKNSSGCELLRG